MNHPLKLDKKIKHLLWLFVLSNFLLSASNVHAQTLCPQVTQLSDDGSAISYRYNYSFEGKGGNDFWSGRTDRENTLSIDSVHVYNESESGFGGAYANWHMKVIPYYLPSECENLSLEDKYECIENLITSPYNGSHIELEQSELERFWHVTYLTNTAILPSFFEWHTFLQGPYDSGDLCEWYEIGDIERTQLVYYENYILWDWDDFCLDNIDDIYDHFPSSHYLICNENPSACVQPRGCADGVHVYLYESDEESKYGGIPIVNLFTQDDYIDDFFILREDRGTITIEDDNATFVFYNSSGEAVNTLIPIIQYHIL